MSLTVLVYFRLKNINGVYNIYYEIFPRWIRALSKIFHINNDSIEQCIANITRLDITRIKHGDDLIKDYRNIRIKSYSEIVDLCDWLTPELEKDPWNIILRKLLGTKAATAASLKFIAHFQLKLYYFSMVLCLQQSLENNVKLLVITPPSWPKSIQKNISDKLQYHNIIFFQLPLIFSIADKVAVMLKIISLLVYYIMVNGVSIKPIKKRYIKIITEYIDPKCFGKTPFDTDFFIDEIKINKKDVLFYLSDSQFKTLKRFGYNKATLVDNAKKNNYNLVLINQLPFTIEFVKNLLWIIIRLLTSMFRYQSSVVLDVFPHIWDEYLMHASMFIHYKADHSLHIEVPNGRASIRQNSAVLTGLCRNNGINSSGCQTRVFDARQYEFCLMCYDTWFSWGPVWDELIGSGFRYVDKIIHVGPLYLDRKIIGKNYFEGKQLTVKNKKIKVIIFTSDIDLEPSIYSGSWYSKNYTIDFLINCVFLAKENPSILFNCKPKDTDHIDLILKNENFIKVFKQLLDNFKFLKLGRTKYMETLLGSDIAITIGYTSPGLDAMLLGKHSIYYSDLTNAGQAFKVVPNFVAENSNELKKIFNKIINSDLTWGFPSKDNILKFDPYQDGRARNRIIANISSRYI